MNEVIEKIDFNIDMFSSYGDKYVDRVASMKKSKAILIEYFSGKKDYRELTWDEKQWLLNLSSDETLGT